MINTENIERLVQLGLASGYIKDNNAPLSLILIANPESGKTKMIKKYICPHTELTSDLSAKAITTKIIPMLEREEIHHIVIPDMIKVLAHKKDTVQSTMTFLNALMEEGIKSQMFFGQDFTMKKNRKCGLITTCTFEYYYKMFRQWYDIGFLSRFIPISFNYSNPTIAEIHQAISENNEFNEIVKMKRITRKQIIIPKDISDKINFLANEITANQKKDSIRIKMRGGKLRTYKINLYGFRLHRQLRKLLQSITILDGRKVCETGDLTELLRLVDYIRLPKNPKEL